MSRCRSRTPRLLSFALCGFLFGLLPVTGCGGGGGGSATAPADAPLRFTIQWQDRSRVILAPSSAVSAVVTAVSARKDGTDLVVQVDRDLGRLAAYAQEVVSSEAVRSGNHVLRVRFYSQTGGQGDVVATADISVHINDDGSGIGEITPGGTVASVTVTTDQSLLAGETKDLGFAAYDASGHLLALTPGAVQFTVASGSDRLRIQNGQAVGVLPGIAMVVATVDGKVSPPQSVSVTSNATVSVTPGSITLPVGSSQTLAATVTGAPEGATGVTWSVQEGAAGGSITPDGVYTASGTVGTYHVVATSTYDSSKSAFVTVNATVAVSVDPSAVTLTIGGTQTFTATVTGAAEKGVLWSVQEGVAGGTITADGRYTSPNVAGTYHVVATSKADPTRFAVGTITCQSGGIGVGVDFPGTGGISVGVD